ncbi:hypothetical protein MPDQ_002544 [Monascus purpureus]|uniref:Uncharacterized protein n=1 Tax=Monascus purpureus TaxID=5098 RepID=A0A507R322_MONPU|nr:hypothetical protein MPDQ_002544 [Monascus purpureus]BDD58533.1 hypothetical protein MAP00_003802 [Monascus purpureus]
MSDARRHWHGIMGDRHEHQNVWVRGGGFPQSQPQTLAPQPSETRTIEERRDSTASTASNTSSTSGPADQGTGNMGQMRQTERRSSAMGARSPSLFQNLVDQKRNSADPSLAQRRQSWNEQMPSGGFLSKWWDEYTKGR